MKTLRRKWGSKRGRRLASECAKKMTRAQYKIIGARMRELWSDPVWRKMVISRQIEGRTRVRIGGNENE